MPVFRYVWGVERPRDKIRRHMLNITVAAAAARAEAEQELEHARRNYERRLGRIEADVAAEKLQLELVRLSTPGGRYDRKIALSVAAKFDMLDVEKRGPGRPPKYGPDDPRPRRPSRAKTRAGRLRAKALRSSGAASLIIPAQQPAQTTHEECLAGASDSTLPDVGPDQLHLDGSTLASSPADEPPQTDEPIRLDPAEVAAKHHRLALRSLQRMAASTKPLSPHDVALRSAYLHAHVQQHHLAKTWKRGQHGAEMHDYDFSDPFDLSKVKAEVRAVCKGFGLSRHSPTYDETNPDLGMPVEDLEDWMKAGIFNNVDYPERDFERYIRECKGARGFYRTFPRLLEPIINAERLRIEVWPYVERRLRSAEWHAILLSRGEIDRDTAQALCAYDDFRLVGRLELAAQAVYRTITKAMHWFSGFSPTDLQAWSGTDDPGSRCRVHDGFPAWAFPSALAAPFVDGHLVDSSPKLDYQPPTLQELIDFAANDSELQIESQMVLAGIGYGDVTIEIPGLD